MDWHDLLFMHWRVAPERLRPYVPPALEIETFDGAAWLGIVPFVMGGTRARLMPPLPGLARFPELNVRTYVRPARGPEREMSGVWFFSLDVTKRMAVEGAHLAYSLPYFKAKMSVASSEWVEYEHERTDDNARLAYGKPREVPARFAARYRAIGAVEETNPGSLESFLTDRYRLYAWSPGGLLYSADIHHPMWPLQRAEAEVRVNTVAGCIGLEDLHAEPLLHFSRYVKVAAWWPRRVEGSG